MCRKVRDYMKDFSQYGNRPDDQWEMLPWIPDPRPPFKIWVKPEQIAPFFLIPHHPYAIVAEGAVIEAEATVGAPPSDDPDWGIAVVAGGINVGEKAVVKPSAMVRKNVKGGEQV